MPENIPTIPGNAPVQSQASAVKRDPTMALRAGNAARGAIQSAQGAIDTGLGVIADYEERKRKMQEGAFFNDAGLIMMKATADYTSQLKGMKSDDITKNWAGISQSVKQTILDKEDIKKLSPNALKLLNLRMDTWQGKTSGHFEEYSGKKAVTEAQSSAHAMSQEALKTGNPDMMDAAKGAIDIAVKTGAWTPAQGKAITDQFPIVLERNQILNGIDNDAYATLQKIDSGGYKKVPETELNTLRNAAEKQVNFVQRTSAGDAINDFSMSGIPKTDKELSDMKAAGKVTGEFVRNYKAMVAREDYKNAENKQALMLNKLRDLDLSDSDNAEKDVRQIVDESASLPPQLQKEIHALGDSKLKAAKKGELSTEQPIHKTQLEMMKNTFDERQGMAKLSKADFRSKYGHAATQPDAESERLRYAKAQKAYIDWSHTKKGAEATPEQAAAERERLGFGEYKSATDVKMALKAGRLDRGLAKEILANEFGIK